MSCSIFGRVRAVVGVLMLFVLPPMGHAQTSQTPTLERVGRVEHPPIDEMSGMVRSRWQENVWWVHNDSGDGPRLFAIDSTGSVHVAPWEAESYAAGAEGKSSDEPVWPGVQLGAAAHIDYEDVAVEDSILYLGDIGNNGNARRDLGIYVISEPFYYDQRSRPITYLSVAYPGQGAFPASEWHFDAEGLFVDDGTIYLLTKHRKDGEANALEAGTKLYRLGTEHPHQVNVLSKVDDHNSIPPPTAAALSPSGDRLAVLSYSSVWLFPRPDNGDRWLSTEPRRISLPVEQTKQVEAVTWDGPQTLRLANEQRDLFVLPVHAAVGEGGSKK